MGSLSRDHKTEFGVKDRSKIVPVDDIFNIPIELIVPDPDQPRKAYSREGLEGLKESISESGLEQPIEVRRKNGHFRIVFGERRFTACKELGFTRIPARIVEVSDEEALLRQITENLQREDINIIDKAHSIERLKQLGYTDAQIGIKLGKSKSYVSNTRRLLNLPDCIKSKIISGQLTEGHARVLLSKNLDADMIVKIMKKVEEGLTVRGAERLAKQLKSKKAKKNSREIFLDEKSKANQQKNAEEPTINGEPSLHWEEDDQKNKLKINWDEIDWNLYQKIERKLQRELQEYRSLEKYTSCLHINEKFCTLLKWPKKPPFFATIDTLYPTKTRKPNYKRIFDYNSLKYFWITRASTPLCAHCSVYIPDPTIQ